MNTFCRVVRPVGRDGSRPVYPGETSQLPAPCGPARPSYSFISGDRLNVDSLGAGRILYSIAAYPEFNDCNINGEYVRMPAIARAVAFPFAPHSPWEILRRSMDASEGRAR